MATWVSHFRLAERVLDAGYDFQRAMFALGNIAPDSGVLNAERTAYDPPKPVTHWQVDLDYRKDIQPEVFYDAHIAGKSFADESERAFKIGYYCHLIADKVWLEQIYRPKKATPLYAELLNADPQNIWEIKKDWYGLDFLYLSDHPQHIFFTDYVNLTTVPDYLDYFPAGAFQARLDDTRAFYLNEPDFDLDRPYIYLNQQEWDDYIQQAGNTILSALSEKALMKPV